MTIFGSVRTWSMYIWLRISPSLSHWPWPNWAAVPQTNAPLSLSYITIKKPRLILFFIIKTHKHTNESFYGHFENSFSLVWNMLKCYNYLKSRQNSFIYNLPLLSLPCFKTAARPPSYFCARHFYSEALPVHWQVSWELRINNKLQCITR